MRSSLSLRIVVLSGAWIAMALAGTALLQLNFYQDHIESHYDAHVQMHMEEMVSAARLKADGELDLAYPPSDPRYLKTHSGWYWEIRHGKRILARSPSLAGDEITIDSNRSPEYYGVQLLTGPAGQQLRVQTRLVPSGQPGENLLLVASAPMMGIRDDVVDVAGHMALSFALLAAGLLVAVMFQVRLALKPINDISRGIGDIHLGTADRLQGDFPVEVRPLVDELNNLLEHSTTLLRRARNQLGDLAHSIKNPLTVINNEARSMEAKTGRLILEQTANIADSVDHHLSRARAFGTTNVLGARVKVKPVAEDLVFALQRIFGDRELRFDLDELGDCSVRCESQDLEEMLGNLMDNACKWAKSRVRIRCCEDDGHRVLSVEDDGPGIPDGQLERVLQRGQRLDESKQGHGLGLGIVQDIVELYSGTLRLERSELGGLRAVLTLPGH